MFTTRGALTERAIGIRFYLHGARWPLVCFRSRMATQPTNLTMHREGPSVWDKQARQNSQCRTMGVIGFLMIAGGMCFVAQAYRSQFSAALSGRMKPLFGGTRRDSVNKASDDSFPASDPPSWTPAVGKPATGEKQL